MSDLITTLHPINDDTTDLYPNVKNENIPPVVSGKDAMEALEGSFDTLKTDEIQIGGENGTLINSTQIATPNKVINLDQIVDDDELAQGLNGKVDKVQGKGLSTNDFTDADKLALETTIPNALDDKVNKEQGKGLSTNDFTNADKTLLETTLPEQLQLTKDNLDALGTAVSGKVDKVSGKGLSTNDYTNADKALVDTIPDKVDKVPGKGLSTNDFTNADKAYLDNLPTYFISIASGGVADVANPPSSSPYFGAKHGTTSNFLLRDTTIQAKVTGNTGEIWTFLMNGNSNSSPMFTHIIPASGDTPTQNRQYKLPLDVATGTHEIAVRGDLNGYLPISGSTEVASGFEFKHAISSGQVEAFGFNNTIGLVVSSYLTSEPNNKLRIGFPRMESINPFKRSYYDVALKWVGSEFETTTTVDFNVLDGGYPIKIRIAPDYRSIYLAFFARAISDTNPIDTTVDIKFDEEEHILDEYVETYSIAIKGGYVDFYKKESVPDSGNFDTLSLHIVFTPINEDTGIVFSTIIPITEYDI